MRQPKRGVLRHGKLENLWISRGFPVLEPKPFPALRLPKMGGGYAWGLKYSRNSRGPGFVKPKIAQEGPVNLSLR